MGTKRQFDGLSPRELQILRLYSRGKCAKEIADALDIRYYTVGTYKKRIMKKLGLENHNHFLVSAITFSLSADGKAALRRNGNGICKPRARNNRS